MMRDADGPFDVIERALRGEASDAELRELAAWRRASPRNERDYRRTARLLAEARASRAQHAGAPPPPSAASVIAAAERRAAMTRRALRRAAGWSVAAAAVLILALQLRDATRPAGWERSEIATGLSELATVKLGDGTVVRLAPSSRLLVEGRRAREVTLEGRAFFAVARLPGAQAFRVHTSAATADVLGTRFELATEPGGVRLTVLEGRVALNAARNTVEVGAGEESGVRAGVAAPPTRRPDARTPPAWLGRFMVFQGAPLRDVARELERLYDVRVLIAEPALADATLTATFTDRSLADVVDVVCAVVSARCTTSDRVVSISR